MKEKTSEGQHHGIEKNILKGNCYYVEVGYIGEERHSRRDARTMWTGKRKFSGGVWCGGPHPRLSHRIELVGVPLVSAVSYCLHCIDISETSAHDYDC